jgi:hypothetical protein
MIIYLIWFMNIITTILLSEKQFIYFNKWIQPYQWKNGKDYKIMWNNYWLKFYLSLFILLLIKIKYRTLVKDEQYKVNKKKNAMGIS